MMNSVNNRNVEVFYNGLLHPNPTSTLTNNYLSNISESLRILFMGVGPPIVPSHIILVEEVSIIKIKIYLRLILTS